MISNQENFNSFIRLIEVPTEDSLNEAIQKIKEFPIIAEIFAQQSPKFVEIFSHLQPGVTKRNIAIKFYQIISAIFSALIPKPDIFFRGLNYLADSLTRRHLDFLIELMDRKKSKIALFVLTQAASVHSTHCRDLFSALDFSNPRFRNFISKEGSDDYIKLATIFLNNSDVSTQFLATKYSLSPIWMTFSHVNYDLAKPFIDALISATSKLNQSTKRWVFNDMTLKSLSSYKISHNAIDSARYSMFTLLQSIMEGPNSIIIEDPQRTYCYFHHELDPPPKNTHILVFLRELKIWKDPSARELGIFILKQSPDLIGRFLNGQQRGVTPEICTSSLTSLLFLGHVVDLDWPAFLSTDVNFFNEGRSLDLLFESILPSVIKNSTIDLYMKGSILHRRAIIMLLLRSVIKFLKLPSFLKTQDVYTKFRGRIPGNLPQFLRASADSPILFPLVLKLIILLDQVFPFYVSDSFSKEPPFIQKFKDYPPVVQHLILKFIPLMQNPLTTIPLLCSLIVEDDSIIKIQIKHKIYSTLVQIIETSDVFTGFEHEIPIFLGEAIRENASTHLKELITLIKGNPLNYIKDGTMSSSCNALIQKTENPLHKCIDLIKLMNSNQNKDSNGAEAKIDLSPVVIMSNLKWYALESATVLLCSSIENNITDLDLTLNCLTIVVTSSPERTLKYVLNHPFIRNSVFKGSETLDSAVSNFLVWNKVCDDDLAQSFLSGNVTEEVIDKISPLIPSKFIHPLIRKLMKIGHPIRPVVSDNSSKYDLSALSPFWQWAFKGFEPVDLSKFWPRMLSKIKDEKLWLDLLRTIYISNDVSLIENIDSIFTNRFNVNDIQNKRLIVFAISILPSMKHVRIPTNLPVSFITDSNIKDPLSFFEVTNKVWSYEFLLQQIRKSQFQRVSSSLSESKIEFVVNFYLQYQTDSLMNTFEHEMIEYIKVHPEIVKNKPRYTSSLFDSIAYDILEPSHLVEFDNSQFEGIANILLGSTIKISLRVILYLATGLSSSPSFYQLIEHAKISPYSFLFATGEVAKVVIQTLDSNQKIYPASLCRNATYLAPFHLVHQNVEIDSPYFRFLLQFAHYLLTTEAVPLDNYMESGAVSILFRALSSKDEHTRNIAYASLSELYDLNMKKKEYSYHNQLQLLLESLINAVQTPGMRFPSLITYFLTMASSIIIKPGHTIFYTLIQFLASDRALRCGSVPLFNNLFGQSTLEYRAQRGWILKMLKNGVNETADVELMKKGKVIERLCSFFASPLSDMNSRKLILEILINASKYTKLEGIMVWAYSLMTELFAAPHIDQIVTLALSIRSKDEIEKECAVRVARLAWSEFRDSLDQSRDKVDKVLCSASLQL
ncbi:hypothetical protein TRFO_37893 [Tritrichomonas foetus]|uniref:Nucleolar pre-ribosomal-associated protein 1 C-terminal domain-containing protein n=1 Tax=Tritrichomonas foetus TaxID=1144522 RepID=A0A1J4JE64_9EUKA|nr:hypothetical protein TRFO_37893 [Tritrichomonas foetus]|eukprot:OHS95955.1 hypothetical protein TRFO_37893 [Tritrichomonas foetus]